jgi:tRNA-2-methylthio-N6-dimethylallyladenosine synthase
MLYYYIWTIGCQMNKVESERLSTYLEHLGYQISSQIDQADLIFLNSCVVRQSAENRVINKLLSLKSIKKSRPQVKIAVTGCFVQGDNANLRMKYPFVDYFFPPGDFPTWLGSREPEQMLPLQPSVATYVPIMQGCDNFCSYCIVPYRRGRERSRPIDELVSEVEELVQRGTREVTLLGQNVDSYGHDLAGAPDLADLLYLLDPVRGLKRIRFLTNHPKDMKDKLIRAVADLDKVCKQINLPVQSGDDQVLQAMRRGYIVENYLELVSRIRSEVPGIALSTDVIVGFPGETDSQFLNTFELLSRIRFDLVHVAAYSPRTGTLAAREMIDDVPAASKKERLKKVEQLQSAIGDEINSEYMDKKVEVLVEGREKGKWFGRTGSDKLVFFDSSADLRGQLVLVRIIHSSPWSLTGEPDSGPAEREFETA